MRYLVIFHFTIEDNIANGKASINPQLVSSYISFSHIRETIPQLPQAISF